MPSIIFLGSPVEATLLDFEMTGSGGLSFAGAADVSKTTTLTTSGGLTFAGSAAMTFTRGRRGRGPRLDFSMVGSGGITFGGSATRAVTMAMVGSGGLTFAGAADAEFRPPLDFSMVGSGGLLFAGAADLEAATTFEYAPSGGITFGGSAEIEVHRSTGPLRFQPPAFGLASVYVHSPYWPRQRIATLTTANNIDRSYTAVSRLGTKDTGQAQFHISSKDPAFLRDPDILRHGNLIVIESPVALPFVGVLVTTQQDDAQIELSCISYESVIDGRQTPQSLHYESPIGSNTVFRYLLDEANARNHTGLKAPAILELTNPVEDFELGSQSVLEALNEMCGRTNDEWWLEYRISPAKIDATIRLGFMQGFDLSGTNHYYQGTHFTGSYKQDMSQVKTQVTTTGDFGAPLEDRNSVSQVATAGVQHLNLGTAAITLANPKASRRLVSLPAGLRNERGNFEVMTGKTAELGRRSGLVQERPLQAERTWDVQFYRNVDWRDVAAGNIVTLWSDKGGEVSGHRVRIMGCQPDEEQGVCACVGWELVA